MPFLVAALYKFVDLPDFAEKQAPLRELCERHGVKGTLLLAKEGVNGTIAGPSAGVQAVLDALMADARLADLSYKTSWASKEPFYRLKIKLKKEIVTMRVPGLDPNVTVGQYVAPEKWNDLLNDPNVVLIDTRNDYEVKIGTFENAIDPHIRTFADLPAWVEENEAPGKPLAPQNGKKPKVAMFCTGGIRCEKSTAFMKMKGYDEVYHLQGGILKYLENVPSEQSKWNGQCFVFDERVSVGHGLEEGGLSFCRACRFPLTPEDITSPHYEEGVSCPHCYAKQTSEQKAKLAERQKQMKLARERGTRHVGAVLPVKEPKPKSAD